MPRQPMSYRQVATDALSASTVRRLWTVNYDPVLGVQPQDFAVGTMLPALFYLFRWGVRRGHGRFASTFSSGAGGPVRAEDVAAKLMQHPAVQVDGHAGPAILGDMVLAHCLEARKHSAARSEPIIRAYPTHYLASWLDLPVKYSNLRYVPDVLAAALSQPPGNISLLKDAPRMFGAEALHHNALLRAFAGAVETRGRQSALTADQFRDEAADALSAEQLIMARIAGAVGEAPVAAEPISGQWPLATDAAQEFAADFQAVLINGADIMPLTVLTDMLECSIAMGLAVMVLASSALARKMLSEGTVSRPERYNKWALFVDASMGSHHSLRELAEESMQGAYRLMRHAPLDLMVLRILDEMGSVDEALADDLPLAAPDGLARVRLLVDVLQGRHARSEIVRERAAVQCTRLARAIREEDPASELLEVLADRAVHPVQRLAEGLVRMMGRTSQEGHFVKLLSSALVADEAAPYRLASQRKVRESHGGVQRSTEARSLVLTNGVLDYVVHRQLWSSPRRIVSYREFLAGLRERYGFFVDVAPPGQPISADVLRQNRSVLERRLRDLGLLTGVNDAESMKVLQPRFTNLGGAGTAAG